MVSDISLVVSTKPKYKISRWIYLSLFCVMTLGIFLNSVLPGSASAAISNWLSIVLDFGSTPEVVIPTSFTINTPDEDAFHAEDSYTLSISVEPADSTLRDVTWSITSGEDIIRLSTNGK